MNTPKTSPVPADSPAAVQDAPDGQPYAGPVKPAVPELDVLHHVGPGETESPEVILRRQLARRGLKYTGERREILEAVLSTHDHFGAEWLYHHLRGSSAKASKATVYRSLALLCECGLIREVCYWAEGTPLRRFGLSHLVVLRRNMTSEGAR